MKFRYLEINPHKLELWEDSSNGLFQAGVLLRGTVVIDWYSLYTHVKC